jgi:mono/diheme cytochrome c family protein
MAVSKPDAWLRVTAMLVSAANELMEGRMKLALLSSTILLLVSTGLSAEPLETGDPQEGFVYAKEVCANCHAILPNQSSPVREAPTFDQIADRSGRSAKAVIERIKAEHPMMPNIPIKRDELNDLAAYIVGSDGAGPSNTP